MSRHRKVRAMDYGEEFDDYYGAFDDDEDDDDDEELDFESKYLSSGIDLNIQPKIQQHKQIVETPALEQSSPSCPITATSTVPDADSNLTRIAIQYLDKHQWQLPLLEMDRKFLDRTYYKHYSENYVSSLRSKLGHFLADNQMLSNPMRYHLEKELNNYQKYSRMFDFLTNYYQSLGSNFFSFATPSPDEEIVIGCRLGTKVARKQPQPKEKAIAKVEQKTARFEYSGSKSTSQQSKQQQRQKSSDGPGSSSRQQANSTTKTTQPGRIAADLTVQEVHTAEQLQKISDKHKKSVKLAESKAAGSLSATANSLSTSNENKKQLLSAGVANKTGTEQSPAPVQSRRPPKQLATLIEKRANLKQKIRHDAEPSAKDLEAFKLRALQVSQEYNELMKGSRARLNLVVVGHVDAGKSTLVGHLLYKLGEINNKQIHRYEVDSKRSGKSSFKFAWALDETNEERARGVTIDIALTKFETPHKDIVILDAPGHVDFIPAVISGAAQADAALLVVDATRGEFETGFTSGGQTREHTFLVRSLGVKSLIVVVNKMDMIKWDPHRYNDIIEQLEPFLRQVGFNVQNEVQFVPVSGMTGENLTERRQDKLRKQSSHPQLQQSSSQNLDESLSLIEAIDNMKPPLRMVDKPTRLCVTDVFKGMSGGVHVAGKLVSGKLEAKQKLILLPPAETCEVKSVEAQSPASSARGPGGTSKAFAGDIVTLSCSGVEMAKYYRGCILCDPILPCAVTNRFQARIIMFQNANTLLLKGTPIEVHMNGTFESGLVRKLLSLLNKNTGELLQRRPRCIAQNASAIIQLKLERVVCCELYESNKDLGRFMMRSCGRTIAAGLITKIKAPKVKKSSRTKMRSKD